ERAARLDEERRLGPPPDPDSGGQRGGPPHEQPPQPPQPPPQLDPQLVPQPPPPPIPLAFVATSPPWQLGISTIIAAGAPAHPKIAYASDISAPDSCCGALRAVASSAADARSCPATARPSPVSRGARDRPRSSTPPTISISSSVPTGRS